MRCEDVGMDSNTVRHGTVVGSWERNALQASRKRIMGIHECVSAAEDGDCPVEKTLVSHGEINFPHIFISLYVFQRTSCRSIHK